MEQYHDKLRFDIVLINMGITDVESLDQLAIALPGLLRNGGMYVPDPIIHRASSSTDNDRFVATLPHPVFVTSAGYKNLRVHVNGSTAVHHITGSHVIEGYLPATTTWARAEPGLPRQHVRPM